MKAFLRWAGWKLQGWPWELTLYPFTGRAPIIYHLGSRLHTVGDRKEN